MTFANMFAVINVICMELPIFLREHFNGMYRTDVYFITKQLAELPVFFITPLIFVGIIYYMVGLNHHIDRFFITLGIAELVTQVVLSFGEGMFVFFDNHSVLSSSGYLLSCAAPNIAFALAVGPAIFVPLMFFGGFLVVISTIPDALRWLQYLSWFRWSNEALLINQWKGVDDIKVSITTLSYHLQ